MEAKYLQFYNSRAGKIAKKLLQNEIAFLWPQIAKSETIGLYGFAGNYAVAFPECKKISLIPEKIGETFKDSALVDEKKLPLRDAELDKIFVVHALENSDSIDIAVAELWRVLKPSGKIIVIFPNRGGMWKKKFAGNELHKNEVKIVLMFNKFSITKFRRAVFTPPFLPLEFFDKIGRIFLRPFCGVFVIEAEKLIYAPRGRTMKIIPSLWEVITKRGLRPAAN